MARTRSGRKSRRVFIQRLSFLGGGVVLLPLLPACKKDEPAAPAAPVNRPRPVLTTSHRTFTNEEWAALCAAVDRIVPKDDTPGAVDAGVPEYIDRMLQAPELSQMKDDFLAGLAALDRRAQRQFKAPLAEITDAQRDELILAFKQSKPGTGEAHFYDLLMVLTMEGFLGDPSYGGNKDKVGWKLVNFNLVGHEAPEPAPGYDGEKLLHKLKGG